jgi:hypothetical protein
MNIQTSSHLEGHEHLQRASNTFGPKQDVMTSECHSDRKEATMPGVKAFESTTLSLYPY